MQNAITFFEGLAECARSSTPSSMKLFESDRKDRIVLVRHHSAGQKCESHEIMISPFRQLLWVHVEYLAQDRPTPEHSRQTLARYHQGQKNKMMK